MTLNKRELAREVQRLIREWGQEAHDLKQGRITEEWYRNAQKNARERLILMAGALAALVLHDEKNPLQDRPRLAQHNQTTKAVQPTEV